VLKTDPEKEATKIVLPHWCDDGLEECIVSAASRGSAVSKKEERVELLSCRRVKSVADGWEYSAFKVLEVWLGSQAWIERSTDCLA
jgi:hypothetical protein